MYVAINGTIKHDILFALLHSVRNSGIWYCGWIGLLIIVLIIIYWKKKKSRYVPTKDEEVRCR